MFGRPRLLALTAFYSYVLVILDDLYYLVILDDFTHYVWTFPLRRKSDALATLTAFYSYVTTQFGRPILAL